MRPPWMRVVLAALFVHVTQQQVDQHEPMLVLNAGGAEPQNGVASITQQVRQQYENFPYPHRNPEHYASTMHPARTSVIGWRHCCLAAATCCSSAAY